jgi:hypothetical protein
MMRAKTLVVTGLLVSASLGFARQSEASPCWDQLMSDTSACLAQRDDCIATTSFWTRTCNLSYLACETGAELAYGDCLAYAFAT